MRKFWNKEENILRIHSNKIDSSMDELKNELFNQCKNEINNVSNLDKIIVKNILLASSYRYLMNDAYGKITEKDFIVDSVNNMYKYSLSNLMNFSIKNSYLSYDPLFIPCLYLANYLYDYYLNLVDNCKKNESFDYYFNNYMILLCRSIRSSLIMFSLGDDVHGFGMLRGILEMTAKSAQMNENFKEFKEFTKINCELQKCKMNGSDLTEKINSFMQKHNLKRNELESYLLTGWIKDNNGKRIRSSTELISKCYEDENFSSIWHFASEFIHEDYLFVDYSYIVLRVQALNLLSAIIISISSDNTDKNIQNCVNQINKLLNL